MYIFTVYGIARVSGHYMPLQQIYIYIYREWVLSGANKNNARLKNLHGLLDHLHIGYTPSQEYQLLDLISQKQLQHIATKQKHM